MMHKFFLYLHRNQIMLALFLIVCGWFIFELRGIIVSIFLSYIIMAALLPFVEYLQAKKFNKILSVFIPYIFILIAIFLLVIPLVPFFAEQIHSLFTGFPQYLNKSANVIGFQLDPRQLQAYFASFANSLSQNALSFTGKIFGSVFTTVTVIVVSFYLLMYSEDFKQWFASMFQESDRTRVRLTMQRVNDKLGAWLRGQVLLSFFIGLMSWIGLMLIGMPFALPLALIAGLLEVVPTLGPILSAIPAVIVALTISPTLALGVVVLYILIQLTENHVIVPKLMQKAVGLNPVVVILGIMIGANLMGIPGALLSIPFISFMMVLFESIEKPTE